MKQTLIDITDFSGGMTLNPKVGAENQFYKGDGLDFRTRKGYLTTGLGWQELTESTSDTVSTNVTSEMRCIIHSVYDNNYYLTGENRKWYKMKDAPVVSGGKTISHKFIFDTTCVLAGTPTDVVEFQDSLVFRLGEYLGVRDLSSGAITNLKSGLTDVGEHCPVHISEDLVFYGHGNAVGRCSDITDSTTATNTALDLSDNWRVRDITDFGTGYLAVGANYTTASANFPLKGKVFLWNKSAESWRDVIDVPENDVKAVWYDNGYLWIWAGRTASLYVVPEGSKKATLMHRFEKGIPYNNYEVYPSSVKSSNGIIYFGLTNDADDVTLPGIYGFSSDPNNFDLNLEKQISRRCKGLGIYRGSNTTNTAGDMVIASHYNGTNNKVIRQKVFETDAYYEDSAYYYSFRYDAPSNKEILTEAFGLEFDKLPSGCEITLAYEKNDDGTETNVISSFTTTNTTQVIERKKIRAKSLNFTLSVKGSVSAGSNNRPFIRRLFVTGDLVPRNLAQT